MALNSHSNYICLMRSTWSDEEAFLSYDLTRCEEFLVVEEASSSVLLDPGPSNAFNTSTLDYTDTDICMTGWRLYLVVQPSVRSKDPVDCIRVYPGVVPVLLLVIIVRIGGSQSLHL